ncbi:MAG TPA: M17 family peptidase N-terminal domain-containing protein, partial [Anaeromyxobacteraceae bacterium]|nr:M17 family peptidase N-terminal domain-containing protein [Anaeromyxobacteraceae bacterium]
MAKVDLSGAAAVDVAAGLLAVPVFEEDAAARLRGVAADLDGRLDGHLARAAKEERFAGKPDQQLALRTLGRLPAARVVLLGLGPRARAGA